jgi:hypothetical protein
LDDLRPDWFKMEFPLMFRGRPQYGRGNVAVSSRTDWRTLVAMSNPNFLEIIHPAARNLKSP